MKKSKIILFLLIPGSLFAQSWPDDIPTLEALIDGHKGKWTGLRERKEQEAANNVINAQVADLSTQYEDIKKKTADRISMAYRGLVFAQEVVDVTSMLVKIPNALADYGTFVLNNAVKHPSILIYYNRSYKGILAEINKCQQLLLYGNVIRATYKQQYDMLMEIKASLTIMLHYLERTLYLCKGIVSLDMGYTKSFEEILKDQGIKSTMEQFSTQIINDFSK